VEHKNVKSHFRRDVAGVIALEIPRGSQQFRLSRKPPASINSDRHDLDGRTHAWRLIIAFAQYVIAHDQGSRRQPELHNVRQRATTLAVCMRPMNN